jgi:hypothetical protein
MEFIIAKPPLIRGPIRYRNETRWLILPPREAVKAGYHERSFRTKQPALVYQRRVKTAFPNQPCSLVDTGQWLDVMGRTIR